MRTTIVALALVSFATVATAQGPTVPDFADLVDLDPACALPRLAIVAFLLVLLGLGAMSEDEDIGMLRGIGAVSHQLVRGGEGEGAFPQPRLAGEQPGVVHPLAHQRGAPGLPGIVVADQHSGAMACMTRAWTSATEPSPSTSAKRSGSAAAKPRKASATRA